MITKWDTDAIKSLSGKMDQKDSSNMLPLHHALKQKAAIDIIAALIQGYPDATWSRDGEGKLPLHYAAEKNLSIEYFKLLLSTYVRGAREKDDKGLLPLHHAVRFCVDLDLVKFLVESFPESIREKDKDGWLPLHFAARDNSSIDVIEFLVMRYAGGLCEKSTHGSLPIHCAAHYNSNLNVIQYLADQYPMSLSIGGNKGMWPIHCAARNNPSLDVLKLLVKLLPSSVNAEDDERRLPLHHSIRNISTNATKYLIDLYPQALRARDMNGWLPIHAAARFSMNIDLLTLLTSNYREGLHALDEEEWLPLHHAARSNLSLEVIKHLIKLYPDALLCKATSVDKYCHQLAPDNSDKKVFLSLLFLALNRESVQSLGVVRLHLIGDGYAGKTVCSRWIKDLIHLTLLNWQSIDLFDSSLEVPMTERTRGMETSHLSHSVTLTDNRVTHYLIHDYAGQQEYLLNHATFLNQPDSIYVLVLPLFDKVRKQRIPVEKLVQRAVFWLKFVYSSTAHLYSHGIPVCIVMNTFEGDVGIPHEELDVLRRRVMAAARRMYRFRAFSDWVETSVEGASRPCDFVLVGDEILLVDARMKFSVKLLIDALKTAAGHYLTTGQSRQSKLQAYCWEILNLLNLSIVMREEDLHFLITSSVKSFFSKHLQPYQLPRNQVLTEEEEAKVSLLKEMKARSHIVSQVEEMLKDYILEILQALGKILIISQTRVKSVSQIQDAADSEEEDEESEAEADRIIITSPHDLSHTILGHLYGNLKSFVGKERSPHDLVLMPSQFQLLLTYLPVMPVTVPRLLVLLGVTIPVRFSQAHQCYYSVFDPPSYNPAYLHPSPTPVPPSQPSGFAAYNLPAPSHLPQSNAFAYNSSSHAPPLPPPPPPPMLPPPPLPSAAPGRPVDEEKSYWAIGLIQKSVLEETDFSKIRLLSRMTHVVTRVFLLSDEKYMLIPGFFVKFFVFLYNLEPGSEALHVFKDAFNLVSRCQAKVQTTSPNRASSDPLARPVECAAATERIDDEEEDDDNDNVSGTPPPPPIPSAERSAVDDATTAPTSVEFHADDDNDDDGSPLRLPPAPEAPEAESDHEEGEGTAVFELRDFYKQILVLPYKGGEKDIGFQVTVAADLPFSHQDYCLKTMQKVRCFLQQEMWAVDLHEHCLLAPTFEEEEQDLSPTDTLAALPDNRFYRSNIYRNLYSSVTAHSSSSDSEGVASGTNAHASGVGFDIIRIEDCENAWFVGNDEQRKAAREQLFGFMDASKEVQGVEAANFKGEEAMVPLFSRVIRPLPLVGPYSTYACAVESLARGLVLADADQLNDGDIRSLLLDRVRTIGATSKTVDSHGMSLVAPTRRAIALGDPSDAVSLSLAQLSDMAQQVMERFAALQASQERVDLARRDPSDLPFLPVFTASGPRAALFTPQGDLCTDDHTAMMDYRLHFLCPVCGQRAPSGRDGAGYQVSLVSRHASAAVLQALSQTLAMCEALVLLVQSNRASGANSGALLALGALLQDSMDVLLKQYREGLRITVERIHRLQNHLFQLMKTFLVREQQALVLAQAGAGVQGASSVQHTAARQALLGHRRSPLVGEEDAHLIREVRADADFIRGLVDLFLAADDQHLLHTGLQRVVHANGSVAWVCSRGNATDGTGGDILEGLGDGLAAISDSVSRIATGPPLGSAVPAAESAQKRRSAALSPCAEEFLRRGTDCLALKLHYC